MTGMSSQYTPTPDPRHIAVLVDSLVGHPELCDLGVRVISCFAWSTENWNRPQPEVDYIMRSTEKHLMRFVNKLHAKNIRFVHTGSRRELPDSVLRVIDEAVDLTRSHTERVFNLAPNYSERTEWLHIARQILARPAKAVSETTVDQPVLSRRGPAVIGHWLRAKLAHLGKTVGWQRGLYYDLWQKQQSTSISDEERPAPVAADSLAEVASL